MNTDNFSVSSRSKRIRRRIDGVFLLDKPYGLSSNTALQKVRWLFSAEKAGHTGTLDPLATGLLPVCLGEATKFSADLIDADKEYLARLQLGVVTNTGDREGEVIARHAVSVDAGQLQAALAGFRGTIRQLPPMFSALKHQGKVLYELARQGIEVERAEREVNIAGLELIEFSGDDVLLRVNCSKGTYIRTLAEDIGKALGCGAHLAGLQRTKVGDLSIDQALTLEVLEACAPEERDMKLAPTDTLLMSLPRVDLSAEEARFFLHGNPVSCLHAGAGSAQADVQDGASSGKAYRVYVQSALAGVGEAVDGWLKPKRLLRLAE